MSALIFLFYESSLTISMETVSSVMGKISSYAKRSDHVLLLLSSSP